MKDDTRPANSAARDKAVGSMTHTKGRLKEGLGELTGNERLKAKATRSLVKRV